MNSETILLIARLAAIGLNILKEINSIIARVEAGDEITDAEIDESTKRVDESVAAWNAAVKKKSVEEKLDDILGPGEALGHDTPGTTPD